MPALYERVRPSLVAVQYTWESELGRRDVISAGVVVGHEATVMTSLALMDVRIPDDQVMDFKSPYHVLVGCRVHLDANSPSAKAR